MVVFLSRGQTHLCPWAEFVKLMINDLCSLYSRAPSHACKEAFEPLRPEYGPGCEERFEEGAVVGVCGRDWAGSFLGCLVLGLSVLP